MTSLFPPHSQSEFNNDIRKLYPLDIARDAAALLDFDPAATDQIKSIMAEAQKKNRWERPVDTQIDLSDPAFWAYWISKSICPIEKAMDGSGLEEHFADKTGSRFDFSLPDETVGSATTLSFVGDLMCTPGLAASQDFLYERVSDLVFGADITYANLESTLTKQDPGPFNFRMDRTPAVNVSTVEYKALTSHKGQKFDVVQLANNHILDCGLEGVETTLGRLKKDGIRQVGVNPPFAPYGNSPFVTKVNGVKIGWIAHTFSVNFKPFPEDHPDIVNMTPFHLDADPDLSRIQKQIMDCRNLGCDYIIVALHWGLEFEIYPHPDQLKWARTFADAGADLIIGHHPHVVQPVEIYAPPLEPERRVPILYSLGNLTPVFSHPACASSVVANLELETCINQGRKKVVLKSLKLDPVALMQSGSGSDRPLQLWKLSELLNAECPDHLHQYVSEMGRYMDIALGNAWRHQG